MKITIFGATGSLGSECLQQAKAAGHDITVLARSPNKLPASLRDSITVIQGDALQLHDVQRAIPVGTEAILFAIGVDEKTSPPNLCTDVTAHILQVMREKNIPRLIWCGGGSNLLPEDTVTFGAKFVRWYSETFLKHRHFDKEHQMALLQHSKDVDWYGIRPLQMVKGSLRRQYRLGYHRFSGLSKISFADCAHAMLSMLHSSQWLHKAPIVQY